MRISLFIVARLTPSRGDSAGEVEDGSKKSVTYNLGEEPPAIKKMLKCIDAIRSQFTLKTPPPNYD